LAGLAVGDDGRADGMESPAYQDLLNVEDVGGSVAADLIDFFHERHNQTVLDDLESLLTIEPYVAPAALEQRW
jgi:DNA ligase (NAD+)